jgi:putative glycosyltransferase (TIGR04372 family)
MAMNLKGLFRRSYFTGAYLWFARGAAVDLAGRVLVHFWSHRIAVHGNAMSADWPWLKRMAARVTGLPARLRLMAVKFSADFAKLVPYAGKFFGALHRIATTRVFDTISSKPNALDYLNDIVAHLHHRGGDALTISCTIGLASKCEVTEISAALARRLVREFPDEVILQQHAGVQAFISGDYATAEHLWNACNRRREQRIQETGLFRLDLRFLGPSWVIAIGHIAHLDSYFKWRELNGRREQLRLSMPVGFRVPNHDLLRRWEGFMAADPASSPGLTLRDIELLQEEFWSMQGPDGNWHMYSHAGASVQNEWQKQQRKPLLSLSEEDRARGREQLDRLGVPEGAWYVCLHVREAGFHQAWHKKHPATRNADVSTYIEAIRAVTEKGGYVIRMGDPTMQPLPSMPGLIEYARSGSKSEFMDVFLCASCRFFIGTNSGLGLVPPVFGVPCALTNWSPIALPQWYPNDLFIPKLCFSERLGRLLSFEEMFSSQAGWGQFADYFVRERIRLIDNTPEDLRELVEEMLERESGGLRESEEDAQRFESYRSLALAAHSYAGARIGRRFLRKHAGLLPSQEGMQGPAFRAAPMYAAV